MTGSDPNEPPASAPRTASTARVAGALGVSVTTVKRWIDAGLLPAQRTAGGHRKVQTADVLRFAREGNLPLADLSRLLPDARADGPKGVEELRDGLHAAVLAGDADAVRAIVLGAYRNGSAVEMIADRIVSPAMRQVGHDWEAGRLEVMHEHRATQACTAALYELKALVGGNGTRDRPVAVGGAPEDDFHSLPPLMVQLTLLDGGWEAVNLGAHTPFSALTTALDELRPQLIWLSVGHLADPAKFIREYSAFYAKAEGRGVAVAVGGAALIESIRARLPYTFFGDGLTHLSAFARTLHRRSQRPRRGRPPARTEDRTTDG